ncbi:ATP-dependent DNA ligase [Bradyrhizobium sp.]|uniref:ATP-dependent DNA ligase n=1 Tax=Bradyrhizobium sp. TaxID=376 RepID=UPI0039E3A4B9
MEARSIDAIPIGEQWQYEPKWDGFRCLLARDGETVMMTSKAGQDLTRYFPEVAQSAAELPEPRFVLDGELVVPIGQAFSFDALLQRIHPAASRIKRLSAETPAHFLAFDLLRRGAKDLVPLTLPDRRRELEAFASRCFPESLFRLSPASRDIKDAKKWLQSAGGGSDGVIAKRLDLPYQSGNRDGMQKIKRHRSADCVIGGFRYGERKAGGRKLVGSLLLGLYDDEGKLHHVGFTSGLKTAQKPGLTDRLEAIVAERSFTGNMPGGPSRWSTKRSSEWTPVKPKLVIEVSYDHFTGGRFRHGTTILRWRPDKQARQCTMDQLQQKFISPQALLDRTS